jgi:GNAT superfamily N-acetyltransferase
MANCILAKDGTESNPGEVVGMALVRNFVTVYYVEPHARPIAVLFQLFDVDWETWTMGTLLLSSYLRWSVPPLHHRSRYLVDLTTSSHLRSRISILVDTNRTLTLHKYHTQLEDLYVTPSRRAAGIGKVLFAHLGRIAKENECGRIEWCVLKVRLCYS